ncbi:MAG: NADH-quinone oxidoreductase subunit J [Actinomycetota bacterium]|nr:NADH-quinone oxidoreductase subunit J [Acidimicrobiia bacterium]MDQ3294573.1 NADH-quinone oxidoreductase subunit J [Actinomycetota bacterium]
MILAAEEALVAQNIFFGLIAAGTIFGALRVVTTKNVVHAALWLVLVLAGVGANFLLVGAEFTGVTQVLVYIGAIVVLFLFGTMLTRSPIGRDEDVDNPAWYLGLIVAVPLLALLSYAVWDQWGDDHIDSLTPAAAQTTADVSDSIFSTYLVAFEAIGFLLTAALIGAIVLARKE